MMKLVTLLLTVCINLGVTSADSVNSDNLFPYYGGNVGRQCGLDGNVESLIMLLAKQISNQYPPNSQGCNSIKCPHRDCADIYKAGCHRSGVYAVYPVETKVLVYCDMDTDGGGWTVFQRRRDGSVKFNRTWEEYKSGFGNLRSEFWLGNDLISLMTGPEDYELRVDMESFSGKTAYAKYSRFSVGSAGVKYKLSVGDYSGTAGDSLKGHNGLQFSTWDQDNDIYSTSCSKQFGNGGFWFGKCHGAYLNGPYSNSANITYATGVVWHGFTGYNEGLKKASMKFRPIIV